VTSNDTVSAVIDGGVVVLYFKSCLRCKDGTVELGSDNFGSYLSCITCGYTINSRSIRANGSIEEPITLDEDVIVAPLLEPVAIEDGHDEPDYEPDFDAFADEDEEIDVFDAGVIELDQAVI
jgi:hypothetical protein